MIKDKIPVVLQKNEVIRASFNLDITESRLVSCALTKLHSQSNPEDGIWITAEELSLTCTSMESAYKTLSRCTDKLMKQQIQFSDDEHDGEYSEKIQWVRKARYYKKRGAVQLFFSYEIFPRLINITHNFTKYELTKLQFFNSRYSFRLFQIWASGKNFPQEYIISIDKLKWMLCLKKNLPYSVFKRDYLLRAIEHSKLAGLWVDFYEIKKGRAVESLAFSIKEIKRIDDMSSGRKTVRYSRDIEDIKEDEESQNIELHLRSEQANRYAEKLIGIDSESCSSNLRILKLKGFSSYGSSTREQELRCLATWLRSPVNAGKVYDLLVSVGYRKRQTKKEKEKIARKIKKAMED